MASPDYSPVESEEEKDDASEDEDDDKLSTQDASDEALKEAETPGSGEGVLLWFDCGSHSKNGVPGILVKVLDVRDDDKQDEPEIALSEHRIKAKALVYGKKYNEALHTKIRCLALARLAYGDAHWQIARAYAELAEAYLKLRKLSLQAVKHAETARNILLHDVMNKTQDSKTNDEDRMFSLLTLELVYFVLGSGNMGLKKYNVAENFLNKSILVSNKMEDEFGLSIADVRRRLEILTAMGKICKARGKLGVALEFYEKAIDLASSKLGQDVYQLIQLHILAGKTELAFSKNSDPDRAITLFESAKKIAKKTTGEVSLEYASCCEMLFRANYCSIDDLYHDRAESNIKEAIDVYTKEHPSKQLKWIQTNELLCQFYISKGRLREAEHLLSKVIERKASKFGDPSEQVGDSFKALGGLFLSQGRVKDGAQYLVLARDSYFVVLGKQHSKSKAIEKLLGNIKKLPAAKELNLSGENMRDRPMFRTITNTVTGGFTKPISFD